jgi:hypothetical protein
MQVYPTTGARPLDGKKSGVEETKMKSSFERMACPVPGQATPQPGRVCQMQEGPPGPSRHALSQ